MGSDGFRPRPFGPYLLLRPLGGGAMGQVHLARPLAASPAFPGPVVVKQLWPELHDRKSFVQRFRHEAEVVISVDSPYVAKIWDAGSVGEVLYLALEYVPGWPLHKVLEQVIASGRHAPISAVLELVGGALEGVQALHEARDSRGRSLQIVHRDLSPKNLMVGDDGRIRIIDLGLGRSRLQSWKTKTGVVMGSVGYMAPEQARGERVDARADVYAMGVVLFEMLALRNYIPPGPVPTMIEASMRPRFVRPSTFRPDVPKGLDEIVERALAPHKRDRYETARDLQRDLESVASAGGASRGGGGRGVTHLLEQLFGTTRQERAEEIDKLLGMTISEVPDESGPTQVFVSRSRLRALEPDTVPLVRTYRASPSQTTDHTVVAAPIAKGSAPVAALSVALGLAALLTGVAVYGHLRPSPTEIEARAEPTSPEPPEPNAPELPDPERTLDLLEASVERIHAAGSSPELLSILDGIRRAKESRDPVAQRAAIPGLQARIKALASEP